MTRINNSPCENLFEIEQRPHIRIKIIDLDEHMNGDQGFLSARKGSIYSGEMKAVKSLLLKICVFI